MSQLKQGTLLQGGKYKIVRHISSGGFGNTYEGFHTMMETRVAIKEFFPKMFCNRDEDTSCITVTTQNRDLVDRLRKKFIEEAKAIFKMNHPNIVKVHDIFEENGTAYYVMDYIDGISLGDIVKQRGALSETEAIGYIRQVADALKYVHSLNRLHLDIKPGNVMVDANGHAILIDFGASKHYDMESGENTSTLMGVNTKGYAPVEQSTQSFTKFSPATDIYALGATLYKLLTGITPPDANLLIAGEESLQPLPANIFGNTRNALSVAMTLKRAGRPQSVEAFLSLLDSKTADNFDDEVTVCVEEEAKRQAEDVRRKAEEEQARKAEEEKARKVAKKSGSKRMRLWAVIGVVAAAGIIIGVKSIIEASEDIEASFSNGVLNVDGATYDMVKVQAGTFTMGATPEMEDSAKLLCEDFAIDSMHVDCPYIGEEKPTHQVTLTNDYFIGKTEVTQALWQAVMGSNPSIFKGDDLPVESVSWDDCQKFISKLNSLTGQKFRLPTEAEWEFAARGGNKSKHYQYSGSNNLDDVAWYDDNSGDQTHPVATKKPNELGIHDMTGNVWEWCSDWYDDYNSSSQTNPAGPKSGSSRVFRGGCWYYSARDCRLSYRYYDTPDSSIDYLGLRLVLVP